MVKFYQNSCIKYSLFGILLSIQHATLSGHSHLAFMLKRFSAISVQGVLGKKVKIGSICYQDLEEETNHKFFENVICILNIFYLLYIFLISSFKASGSMIIGLKSAHFHQGFSLLFGFSGTISFLLVHIFNFLDLLS